MRTPSLIAAVAAAAGFVSTISAQDAAADPVAEGAETMPDATLSLLDGWEGSVTAGVNGSTGNTENLNLRGEIKAGRESRRVKTSLRLLYSYATSDGEESENRFFGEARNDWKLGDSKWRLFVQGSYEYDEFKAWDHRVTLFAGAGYAFIENDKTTLVGRAGLGGAYEIGDDDDLIPEALLGVDFEHQLTERQTIAFTSDLFPSLEELGDYRVRSLLAWEVMIDPEVNLVLRAGIESRYDSSPGEGVKRHDLDYFIALGWSF